MCGPEHVPKFDAQKVPIRRLLSDMVSWSFVAMADGGHSAAVLSAVMLRGGAAGAARTGRDSGVVVWGGQRTDAREARRVDRSCVVAACHAVSRAAGIA